MAQRKDKLPRLAQRIATLRKTRGLTQLELAEALGVSQGLISMYENGVSEPAASILARLAKTLGVSADALLGLEKSQADQPLRLSRRLVLRLEQIEDLPAHHQRTLLKTIDTFLKGAQVR